jgi:PAS domain S-box-containing protein
MSILPFPIPSTITDTNLQTIKQTLDAIGAPAFLLSCEDDGEIRYQYFNKTHVEQVGIPSIEVEGKIPHQFFPARLADTLVMNYRRCRDTGAKYTYEEMIDLKDGERWWNTSLMPMFDGDKVIGIVGVATDITELKSKELKIAEDFANLQKMKADISLFAQMTVHDIRGPLGQIRHCTSFVLEDAKELESPNADLLATTKEIAEKTLSKVDNMLAHTNSHNLHDDTHEPEELDLHHFLYDLIAVIDPHREVKISFPAIRSIKSEKAILHLIMRNLLENAKRHGATKVSINLRDDEKNNGHLCFVVADNGESFQGGNQEPSSVVEHGQIQSGYRGFGMSAISQSLTARNSSLRIGEPVFGSGTTFIFDLPGGTTERKEAAA